MLFKQVITSCLLAMLTCTACGPKNTTAQIEHSPASRKATQANVPVVIVGAGLTGLITAYELNKAGIPSIILEEKDHVGGRIETVIYQQQATAEARLDEFFAHGPILPILKELNVPLVEDNAHSAVRIDGKIYTYQGNGKRDEYLDGIFTPDEKAAFLKWNNKTLALYNELQAAKAQNKPLPPNLAALINISFADYVKQDNLPHKVSEWIRITLEPDIATEWNNIAALDGIDEMGIFLDTPKGFGEKNYHIENGNALIPNTLAKKLPEGSIWKGCHVSQITQTDEHVIVNFVGADHEPHSITSKYVVVTVPLYAINRIKFKPSLEAERQKAIDTTRFGNYVKINFRCERGVEKTWEQYNKGHVFTLLTDSPVGTIYDISNYNKNLKPEDQLLFTLLVQGKYATELMDMSSADVGKTLKEKMNAIFPNFTDYVTKTDPFVYPTAVAYWPVALKRSRFDDLSKHMREPFGHVFIGGDTTDSSHADGAVEAALRMSKEIEEQIRKTKSNTVESAQ